TPRPTYDGDDADRDWDHEQGGYRKTGRRRADPRRVKLTGEIDRAAPCVAGDFLDDDAAVGAANGERVRIDWQAVVPPQRLRVERHAAAQPVRRERWRSREVLG